MTSKSSPRDTLRTLKRRRFLVATLTLAGMLAAAVFATVKPRYYQSETRLRVRAVGTLAAGDDLEKVQAVERDIRNFMTFDEVIKALELDAPFADLPPVQRDAKRDQMVKDLMAATKVSYEQAAGAVFLITIEHQAPDPDLSFRIVNELAKGYEAQSYERPLEDQEKVVEQRQQESDEARQELDRITALLNAFETEHGELLAGTDAKLADLKEQIQSLETVDIASLEADVARNEAHLKDEPPRKDVEVMEINTKRVADVEAEIRKVKSEIATLQHENKFTDEHPKMVGKRQILVTLEQELERAKTEKVPVTKQVDNPAYMMLRKSLAEATSQLGVARRKLSLLRRQQRDLLEVAGRVPEVRNQHEKLEFDQMAARQAYDERNEALEAAKDQLAQIRDQRQLVFEHIDPPVRPRNPAGPHAAVLAVIGLLAGACAGAGSAYALDSVDRSFREIEPVSGYLSLPTLGAIHRIMTPEETERLKAVGRRRGAMLCALAIVALAAVTLSLVWDGGDLAALLTKVGG